MRMGSGSSGGGGGGGGYLMHFVTFPCKKILHKKYVTTHHDRCDFLKILFPLQP